MSRELFTRIIAEVAPLTEEVCLHLMGEPLGHPELAEFVDICAQYELPINLTTNGTLLDDRRASILLRPIVRQINFSLQSFEANFGEQDPSRYLDKIFKFTHRALVARPGLYVNYRLWDQAGAFASGRNQAMREKIASEFGVSIETDKIDLRQKKGYPVKGRLYLNFDSRFEWPSLERAERTRTGFCHGLSNHFGIHADGQVVPCCLDKEAVLALGDCQEQTLAQILGGPRAESIRAGFARGELVEELCRRCPFIERFDRKAARFSAETRRRARRPQPGADLEKRESSP